MKSKVLLFTLKRFAYIGFLGYLLPILIGYAADEQFNLQRFHINLILVAVILAFAAVLIFFGNYHLIKYGNGTPNPEMPPGRIVRNGIYKQMRHPIYFGWILALFAASGFYGSMSMLIISILLIPIIHAYSTNEEKILLKRFGRLYADYKKKVPMWFPRFRLK